MWQNASGRPLRLPVPPDKGPQLSGGTGTGGPRGGPGANQGLTRGEPGVELVVQCPPYSAPRTVPPRTGRPVHYPPVESALYIDPPDSVPAYALPEDAWGEIRRRSLYISIAVVDEVSSAQVLASGVNLQRNGEQRA